MLGANGKSLSADLDAISASKKHEDAAPTPAPAAKKRNKWAIPLEHIPRIFSIMKWLCLIV